MSSNATLPMAAYPDSANGLDPLYQLGILAGVLASFLLFAGFVQWAFAQTVRRITGIPTAEEQEQRRRFVQEHLKSVEWNRNKCNHCCSSEGLELGLEVTINGSSTMQQQQQPEEDDNQDECPICLGSLEQGEWVSSSTNPVCPHVFHRDCIHEWLLQKTECPMCRCTFLIEPSLKRNPASSETLNEEEEEEEEEVDSRSPLPPLNADTTTAMVPDLEYGNA